MENKRLCFIKTKYVLLFCLVSVLFGVTGCSPDKTENIKQISTPSQISYSWWGNDVRHQYTMDAVDEFQKKNPDINVQFRYGNWDGFEKKMQIYMKSHTEPDVMLVNYAWLEKYSFDGTGFYDLNELSEYIDLSNFSKEDLEFGMRNGKLNAIPIAFNTQSLYYNQSLYEEYGLELPQNWEDYFEAAKVMKKDGIYPLGMSQKPLFFFLIAYYQQTTGRDVVDSDGSLAFRQQDIRLILKFYKRLLKEKVLMPVDMFDRTAFLKGKVAGTVAWISDAGSYCTPLADTGASVVVGKYPLATDAKRLGWFVKPATMYAVSKLTKFPEDSARLLDFLLNSEEMALKQGTEKGIPISKKAVSVLEDNDCLTGYEYQADQQMMSQKQEMEVMIPEMEDETVIEIFKEDADLYLYDKESLETVAMSICKDLEE